MPYLYAYSDIGYVLRLKITNVRVIDNMLNALLVNRLFNQACRGEKCGLR